MTSPNTTARVSARDHIDPDGSVVRSGMALAEAVLRELKSSASVEVSLEGLHGASSSYFNVFLRRIDEECGIAEMGEHIHVRFGSRVQEMVYNRSLESVSRGPRKAPTDTILENADQQTSGSASTWTSWLRSWRRRNL